MAVTRDNNVIVMTADNDTINMGKGGFHIAGIRLVAGQDEATALIKDTNTSGTVIASLKAGGEGMSPVDEMGICFRCDPDTLHLDLTGTGAVVYIYLK